LRFTLLLLFILVTACTADKTHFTEKTINDGDPALGREAILNYGCGSCHIIGGIPGANSHIGPPLTEFHKRSYIAGNLPNNGENLILWIKSPQGVEPGTVMPNLGVTDDDARHIAAYLYQQPNNFFGR
jgi:cytochrome c